MEYLLFENTIREISLDYFFAPDHVYSKKICRFFLIQFSRPANDVPKSDCVVYPLLHSQAISFFGVLVNSVCSR